MARVTNGRRNHTTKRMEGGRDDSPATLTLPSNLQGEEPLGLTMNRDDGR